MVIRHSPLDPPPHRVDAVEAGGLLFVSGLTAGMTARDREKSLKVQTRQTLDRIDRVLAAAGTDKSRLVWASVWLNDTDDYEAFNELWNAWIVSYQRPARACIGANLAPTGVKVEIAVVAAVGKAGE